MKIDWHDVYDRVWADSDVDVLTERLRRALVDTTISQISEDDEYDTEDDFIEGCVGAILSFIEEEAEAI